MVEEDLRSSSSKQCLKRTKASLPFRLPRLSFSISLRTILLIVLAIAVLLAWYVNVTQREYVAQQAIRRIGGGTTTWVVERQLVPKWLSKLTGEKLIQISVSNVYFTSPEEIGDGDMKYVLPFHKLWRLNLTGTKVGDCGLKYVRELEHLQELRLDYTQITDQGLQHLTSLNKLKDLYMLHTDVTDEGVERLQQSLPQCHIRY